ncbi:large subunit ribosomal protein L14e [Geosmithia morbida]|uniref:Large subunit ribosomal protein L14e n=1 Tax=Geosmithia morbida TaxID=1094350 RepID=A0A9P4YZP7_9HYPO|nr:large subunit ribosomal protein L14e [Geosmithia morbida]KAF4124747.1 large subunit ribosomal protein L14e [Geosmithia morbida]
MGEALIEGSNWRLVEVGRVVAINGDDHPHAGRIAAIVEIIDHKRVLVEGPSSDPELACPRQPLRLSRALLSPLVVEGLTRGARHAKLKKEWESSEIDAKWKETNWAKKRDQIARRNGLSDFDRFKVMRLKKQQRFEERKALAKIKASA